MKFAGILAAFAAVLCAISCASNPPRTGGAADESSREGFKNLMDSVVKIDVWTTSQKDGGNRIDRSIGSGVIMTEDGMILTNSHVVNEYAVKLVVTLANLERVPAKFVGWDHWTDLAVIKLDTDDLRRRNIKFSHAKFGDSDTLAPGDEVYAVGTPHGFARTVTRGIVSNTTRYFEGTILNSGYETGVFNTWIQTDAAINPGNSGGPLALPNGDVVGINTRAYTNSNNLGFAVPVNAAKSAMEELLKRGRVRRAYIGITPAPLQDMEKFFDLDMNKGALIRNVDAGSPAKIAGVLPGDILLKINGREIDGRFPEQLPAIMSYIASLPIGSDVKLEIMRDGRILEKTAKSEELESRVGREYALEKWGAGMREITKPFARQEKITADSRLMVIGIRSGFPFELAGIEPGDIIISVNRKKVSDSKDLQAAYDEFVKNKKDTLFGVLRNFSISYHIVKPQEK
ncbi:MAG: peptidase S1 [Verrucomicrobia bacterium]|nr:MAG: peptidase S1 [Verrucomicrobiota bacterium]